VGCRRSADHAVLTLASPGDSASGGGWYTLAGSGRINFGFTVQVVDGSDPVEHRGQLLLINNGKWRLKATLHQFGQVGDSGAVAGVGTLYRWDDAAQDWVLSATDVSFTASFTDQDGSGGKGGKNPQATDTFGIHIDHLPVGDDPSRLPNSEPQPLSGGNVRIGTKTTTDDESTGGKGGGKGGKGGGN
jgi:hypothetical protein